MHQQDLYGFVKHSQLRERKTDPKSQIIISRSFVLTFVDIGFLKQIGNNEVQIINILEVKSYLFTGVLLSLFVISPLCIALAEWAPLGIALVPRRGVSLPLQLRPSKLDQAQLKTWEFWRCRCCDACQIISHALQMKSKLQYVSMFAGKLLSLEEKLCRPAAKYYWLLASKSASHG